MNQLLVIICLLMILPAGAQAHGGAPLSDEVVGVGGSDWVLRANFGVITSEAPQAYVCEEVFGAGDRFLMAALGVDEWLIFTFDSILYTADGCSFERIGELPMVPAGVAVSPDRSRVVYLVNSGDEQAGLWWSEDAGQSFERAPIDDARVHLTRAAFLDDDRVLVSAYLLDEQVRGQAELLVVDLTAETVTALDGLSGYGYPYVFDALDDSIVWLGREDDKQVVLWGTLDEPARHRRPVDSWPSGAALSDDGQTVWLAGLHEEASGVVIGQADADPVWSEAPFTHSALCIGRTEQAHLLCAHRAQEGHDLSLVGDDHQIEQLAGFVELQGPRDCPADSDVARVCPAVWQELAPALGIDTGVDTGDASADAGPALDTGAGAGADAAEPPGSDNSSSGGCSHTPGESGTFGWLWVIGVLVARNSSRSELL
jgi:hypothetical protein